jgi:hypothetical protein
MVRDGDVAMAATHPLGRRPRGTGNRSPARPLIGTSVIVVQAGSGDQRLNRATGVHMDRSRVEPPVSSATDVSEQSEIYIRGAHRRGHRHAPLGALITYGGVLTVLVVVLTIQVVDEHARASRLHKRGQQVTATITACRALASGTGITAAGFRCDGSYTVGGQPRTATVRGTTALYAIGQTVPVFVDPHHPDEIATAAAAIAPLPALWRSIAVPAIPLLLLMLSAAWVLRRASRRRARQRL